MTLIEKTLVKTLMISELECSKSLSKDVQSMYELRANGNVCLAKITPIFDFSLDDTLNDCFKILLNLNDRTVRYYCLNQDVCFRKDVFCFIKTSINNFEKKGFYFMGFY